MHKLSLQGFMDINCYIVDDGHSCYIVDPGAEKNQIVSFISNLGLEVLGILLTHAHVDHIGAIDCYPVPIYLHKEELPILYDATLNGSAVYGIPFPNPHQLDVRIVDEDVLVLGSQSIRVLHTPGHTIGSTSYIFGEDIFTGDTLFKGSIGRCDFPTGNIEMIRKSVTDILESFPGNYSIHPGHGESSKVVEEKQSNLYYLMWK